MTTTTEPRVNGHAPAVPTPPAGAVDRLAELVDATGDDRRARRRLLDRAGKVLAADAEAERRARSALDAAERRARAAEVEAEARIRAAEASLRIQEREREARRAERAAEADARRDADQQRAEDAERRRTRWAARREAASATAPATLSMLVYSAAVASAVFGQVSVATGRYGWAPWRALVLAGFIELMALAMALTANRLRLRGERALAPRVLTWVFAGFAAVVNVWGHLTDPLMAIGLGAASLGGITLWEIRSSARHRDALRAAGQLAEPLPPLGMRFWLLAPGVAMTAYRIGVRTRVSLAAADLVAQAEAERAARRAAGTRRARTGWWAAAAFAAGLAASAALARVPAAGRVPASWWIAAAGCAVAALAIVTRPRRGQRAAARPHDDHTTTTGRPADGQSTATEPATSAPPQAEDSGHTPATTAATQAPPVADENGHDAASEPATSRPCKRPTVGQPSASNPAKDKVARYVRRHPKASVPAIVDQTGVPERSVRRYLQQIRAEQSA